MAKQQSGGEKNEPRSAGYRRLHVFLCVLGSVILFFCLGNTLAARNYVKDERVVKAMRDCRLSDFKIPFTGQTAAEYIREEFVGDDNVLLSDVEAAVDSMQMPYFVSNKTNNYRLMLLGESRVVEKILPQEISARLSARKQNLYDSYKLVIEDADIEEIERELTPPLDALNSTADFLYGSQAGRVFARFRLSIWTVLIEVVLLLLLLWRWSSVCAKSGVKRSRAVRGMGITLAVMSGICFLVTAVSGISAAFVKDGVVGLYPLAAALRRPFWPISIVGLVLAALTIWLAVLCGRPKQEKVPERASAPAPAPVKPAPVKPAPAPVPVKPAAEEPAAEEPAQEAQNCIRCGRALQPGAEFCIYCGAKQTPQDTQP